MIALARLLSLAWLAALVGSACGSTDVVAYRVIAGCTGPSCPAGEDAGRDADVEVEAGMDAALDAGPDAAPEPDAEVDAGPDAGPATCAAAVCDDALSCASPIPRAIVGDGCGDQPWAAPGFRYALCACDDFVSEFPLTVERAPDAVEPAAASVAIDDDFTAGAQVDIAGGLFVSGMLSLLDQGSLSADDVQSETGIAACDCGADKLLAPPAVLALVPSNPDGFDATRFVNVTTDESIALDCGAYRVPRIAGPSGLNLAISGHVVLVVEGDIELDANLEATLAQGALLELFVVGKVRVAGALLLGAQGDHVRTYVLGSGTIDLGAEVFLAGPLYAPNAELVTRSQLTSTGSIFVRRAAPGGAVVIRYDGAASHAGTCD